MKMLISALSGAVLLLGCLCAASALPGQQFAAVKAQVARKAFAMRCPIGDMSGAPICTVTGRIDGRKFIYHFSDDVGHLDYQESLRYDAPGFSFLVQSDPRLRALLAAVYDDGVAQDFISAKRVATVPVYQSKTHATFLRGKRFGYVTGAIGTNDLTLFRVRDLDHEIANAKKCATMECGD